MCFGRGCLSGACPYGWTWLHNLRTVFAKHWLEGFALWHPKEGKARPLDKELGKLRDYMGLVRQAAALYRIDRASWEALTLSYIEKPEDIYETAG